jgi:FlaA1/EpsC-like NDP-sugar epimerase
MGATKRVGEELLKVYNLKGQTKFISVRFGNVLGSRGSVVEIFKEQIKKGGPVHVTHPEMKRYFMIVSEAVLLVLEAAAMGEGGEVYVLDMGKHIKIVDLAKEMIRLSGYEPDRDVPIIFTQARPGEKLYEEILLAEEGAAKTNYDKIYRVKSSNKRDVKNLVNKINSIIEMGFQNKERKVIVESLTEIVPTYTPSEFKLRM